MKEGWEYKKLSELFDITSSKRVFQSEWKSFGVPFYRAREIVQLSKNGYVDNELFITEELYTEYIQKYGKPQIGDIMVTGVGTLGICYLVKPNDMFYFKDGNIIWMKKKTDNLSEYIEYAFKSFFVKSQVNNSSGATVGTYTIVRANQTIVPIPQSIDTQKHIVGELDLLSSIIEKKKAQLNELDNLAQSLFYEMFGDPITNEKGWEVIRLGDKCHVSSFKRVLIEDVVDKGIPFVRGTELMMLSNGDDVDFTLFITPKHYEIVKEISGVPNIGDLLIPSINSKGNIWIVDTEQPRYYKDGRVLWVHVDSESYTSETLKVIMSILIQKSYSVVASGATFAELKLFVLRDLRTIIPPISIQQQYSERIKAIERQKKLVKQSIKEVETLFNSRMDFYFN